MSKKLNYLEPIRKPKKPKKNAPKRLASHSGAKVPPKKPDEPNRRRQYRLCIVWRHRKGGTAQSFGDWTDYVTLNKHARKLREQQIRENRRSVSAIIDITRETRLVA